MFNALPSLKWMWGCSWGNLGESTPSTEAGACPRFTCWLIWFGEVRPAGGPGLMIWNLLTWETVRGYHFNNSRGSREAGLPQVPVFGTWVLGWRFLTAEFPMPAGLKRLYGKGNLHFITFSCFRRLPLLKTGRARDVFVKELSKIRDEMGFHLIGYVVMPEHASADQRVDSGDAFDDAAEIEAARGAKVAQAQEIRERSTIAIAVCGGGRTFAGVLAGAVLRLQCVPPVGRKRRN
jgi:hypothetical protein